MKTVEAAVLWPGQKTFSIESLQLEDPRAGEVLIRLVACGICHTDIVLRDGTLTPHPVVLGHEGAGIVEQLGPGVTDLQVGDRVVASFASCGACPACQKHTPGYCEQFYSLNFSGSRADGSTSLSKGGRPIHSHIFGQSSFSTYAVCPETNLVKVDASVPLQLAGPFGCAFQTGAGAVLNSFEVAEGNTVMVLGAGAVGLAALMAAAGIARAKAVISVDLNVSRLEIAHALGATMAIDGAATDLERQVKSVCPRGVDFILDTTGHLPFVEQCVDLLAVQGTLGLAASYPLGARTSFDAGSLMASGKKIQGVMEGDSDIRRFIPELLDFYRQGKFPVDRIVRYYDLHQINTAIEDAERGDVIKAILTMP